MEASKPACPQHGVREMHRTYRNGDGSWYRCSVQGCQYQRWVDRMDAEATMIRAILVFCLVFGWMKLIVH